MGKITPYIHGKGLRDDHVVQRSKLKPQREEANYPQSTL
jgi:hypothetical protein